MNIYARIRMFFSLISMTISLQSVNSTSPAGELPWDGMPGGTREVRNELDGDNLNFFPFNITMPFGLGIANASYTAVEDFCFVPVTSSLDITDVNLQSLTGKYVGGISPGNPSRAANFIAQEGPFTNGKGFVVSNNGHRFFTARNARWLFNEMQGITPNDLNCSSQCQPSGFSITGPTAFCNSDNYVFENLPSNGAVTITWSATPSGIVTLTTNPDKSVTLTKIGNGNVTLTATIAGCNFTNNVFSKTIHVGSYTNSNFPITGTGSNGTYTGSMPYCIGYPIKASIGGSPNNVSWVLPPNWQTISNSGNNLEFRPTTGTPGSGAVNYVVANYTDACGTPLSSSIIVSEWIGACPYIFPYSVSPNPASSYVNIYSGGAGFPIQAVQLVSMYMGVLRTAYYSNGTSFANFSVSGVGSGTYTLKVYNGTQWYSTQIIVQQ